MVELTDNAPPTGGLSILVHQPKPKKKAQVDELDRMLAGCTVQRFAGNSVPHQEKTCQNFIPYGMKWATVKKSTSFHTIKLAFHTYTNYFILANVISYFIVTISYLHMSCHTCNNLFHTCKYYIIPAYEFCVSALFHT